MEPPKFYRKYTSGSDSEESESYISDTDSDSSSRQSQVSFTNNVPNFADLAKAYDIEGYKIETAKELETFISNENLENKAFLLDIIILENENCYPMVAPGRSNSQMLGLEQIKN